MYKDSYEVLLGGSLRDHRSCRVYVDHFLRKLWVFSRSWCLAQVFLCGFCLRKMSVRISLLNYLVVHTSLSAGNNYTTVIYIIIRNTLRFTYKMYRRYMSHTWVESFISFLMAVTVSYIYYYYIYIKSPFIAIHHHYITVPVAFCCRPGRGADGEFSFGASKEKPPCFAPDRNMGWTWMKYVKIC